MRPFLIDPSSTPNNPSSTLLFRHIIDPKATLLSTLHRPQSDPFIDHKAALNRPKMTPDRPKIDPRSTPDGPKIHHKCTPDRPKVDQRSNPCRRRIDAGSTLHRHRIGPNSTPEKSLIDHDSARRRAECKPFVPRRTVPSTVLGGKHEHRSEHRSANTPPHPSALRRLVGSTRCCQPSVEAPKGVAEWRPGADFRRRPLASVDQS